MLAATVPHQGGRPAGNTDTLSALLGVDSDAQAQQQSSRWQRVAAVPEAVFDAHVEKVVGTLGADLPEASTARAGMPGAG